MCIRDRFSSSGDLVLSASAPLPISYPADGWVEQDPIEIWTSQRQALVQLDSKLSDAQRKAVVSCGITNQRETTATAAKTVGKDLIDHRVRHPGRGIAKRCGRCQNLCSQPSPG